jgi:hypothetical protein
VDERLQWQKDSSDCRSACPIETKAEPAKDYSWIMEMLNIHRFTRGFALLPDQDTGKND